MIIDLVIAHSPEIIETRVKEVLINVAKEHNIPNATEMTILVRNENERIIFIIYYNNKEITRIPFDKINENIGSAVEKLIIRVFKKEAARYHLNEVFVNFIMKLQSDGVILVWPYHEGIYEEQMRIQQFLAL